MNNDKTGETPNTKTELKVEKPKTIVIARQKTILVRGFGIWPLKISPSPARIDKTVNDWLKEMALKGQPAQLGKYLSNNGDMLCVFLYNERINID